MHASPRSRHGVQHRKAARADFSCLIQRSAECPENARQLMLDVPHADARGHSVTGQLHAAQRARACARGDVHRSTWALPQQQLTASWIAGKLFNFSMARAHAPFPLHGPLEARVPGSAARGSWLPGVCTPGTVQGRVLVHMRCV